METRLDTKRNRPHWYYTATPFGDRKYRLGESPFYSSKYNRFSWVDILDGKLYTMIDGKIENYDMGQHIGAAIPMEEKDGFIIAGFDGLYTFENGNLKLLKSMKDEFKPYQRCNDAKLDPCGRVWFGSSVDNFYNEEASGNLYVYDGGVVRCMQSDTKISNGMAWSRDRKTFYFADSLYNAVFKYDYDIETGNISNRQEFFKVEMEVPDGMCIDSKDRLWVAVWGGSRIECHHGTTGELLSIVEVDAKNVTSCCFYDDDKLFITTSGEYSDGEYDGCLFMADLQ